MHQSWLPNLWRHVFRREIFGVLCSETYELWFILLWFHQLLKRFKSILLYSRHFFTIFGSPKVYPKSDSIPRSSFFELWKDIYLTKRATCAVSFISIASDMAEVNWMYCIDNDNGCPGKWCGEKLVQVAERYKWCLFHVNRFKTIFNFL